MKTDFGPNTEIVEEVRLLLIRDTVINGLLTGNVRMDSSAFQIIEDLETATRLAWVSGRPRKGFADWSRLSVEASPSIWVLKDPVGPDLEEERHRLRKMWEHFRWKFVKRFHEKARDHIGTREYNINHELAHSVVSDCTNIAIARLHYGLGHPFYELMFSAYKQGGWPCGWKGEYPQGRMVVYHIGPKL